MTLFCALCLPLVLSLGYWQLQRAAQKRSMESEYLARLNALPLLPAEINAQQSFARVALQGRYAEEIFLVDNQVRNGVVGYWVVQVFDDAGGQRFLTNRGFVAGMDRRERLPVVDVPAELVKVVGTVWPFMGLVPVWGADDWSPGWPKRVQRLDVERMAALVDAVSVEVRLESGQPGVGAAAPVAKVLSDARHRGYAATWFGLAAVLAAGFVVFGFANPREKDE